MGLIGKEVLPDQMVLHLSAVALGAILDKLAWGTPPACEGAGAMRSGSAKPHRRRSATTQRRKTRPGGGPSATEAVGSRPCWGLSPSFVQRRFRYPSLLHANLPPRSWHTPVVSHSAPLRRQSVTPRSPSAALQSDKCGANRYHWDPIETNPRTNELHRLVVRHQFQRPLPLPQLNPPKAASRPCVYPARLHSAHHRTVQSQHAHSTCGHQPAHTCTRVPRARRPNQSCQHLGGGRSLQLSGLCHPYSYISKPCLIARTVSAY